MGFDAEIANWVLEFLLRQPLDDRTLDSLLRVLPLPNDKCTLKKQLLLKKLEFDVSSRVVSERTLEVLEQLEEIEFQQGRGNECSDSMRRAYCAVAVECTVRILENGENGDDYGGGGGGDGRRFEFFEVVVRVWRGKIGMMEKGGLGSEDLWLWKDEMEAAVWDDRVCESIKKKRREGVGAVEAVSDYLKEEREKLGPSFLEVVADRLKHDEISWGALGVGSVDHVAAGKDAPLEKCVLIEDVGDLNNEIRKEEVCPSNKLVGLRCSKGLVSRNSKRAKFVHSDEMTMGPSYRNHNLQSSEAISKVARDNNFDDPMEVKHVEANTGVVGESEHHNSQEENRVEAISGVAQKSESSDPAVENRDGAKVLIVDGAGVVRAIGLKSRDAPRPSLMDRNTSARTYEWDESIDGHQDDPEEYRASPRLCTRRTINVSPLKKHENRNSKRRIPRKWSILEEDTLREGVQKYGKGNWKFILMFYHDIFQERTYVDLKDKWRNLTCR